MIKRTTLIVTAVIGLLLLAAGGVAAAYYLSSTMNVDQNTIDSEYIVISSTDYSDFLNEVSFDTTISVDPLDNVTITYDLNADTDIWDAYGNTYGVDGTADACLISNAMSINVAQTNTTGGYDLEITVSAFSPIAGLTYTMKVGTQYCTYGQTTPDTWTFHDLTFGTDYAVALYVSGTPSETPGSTVGFTNYDPNVTPKVIGSVFTFTATAPNGAP